MFRMHHQLMNKIFVQQYRSKTCLDRCSPPIQITAEDTVQTTLYNVSRGHKTNGSDLFKELFVTVDAADWIFFCFLFCYYYFLENLEKHARLFQKVFDRRLYCFKRINMWRGPWSQKQIEYSHQACVDVLFERTLISLHFIGALYSLQFS